MIDHFTLQKRIDYCRTIVKATSGDIVIINMFGAISYYYAKEFLSKSITNPYNELRNGINITSLIESYETNFTSSASFNVSLFEGMADKMTIESFKFGFDDYLWITEVQ